MHRSTSSTPSHPTVLVVDDNRDVLTAVRLLLREVAAQVQTAASPDALPTLFRERTWDVVLLDMNFSRDASSGREGLRWLENLLQMDPDAIVIMITGYGDLDLAVRAMKMGAADFITKPWSNERLLSAVKAAAKLQRERKRMKESAGEYGRVGVWERRPEDTSRKPGGFDNMIGESEVMQAVFETIEKVAPTGANVLILGENGTGKELVARAIHDRSQRIDKPFVPIDLGAVPSGLFESELFGHRKGAFTDADQDHAGFIETADGGTLFLDEIGNIGLPEQGKLLAVLERRAVVRVGERTPRAVDVRLVSATNAPLRRRVAEGAFREDLFYRLNTVEIPLPPLRERGTDIDLLADHFLAYYAERYGRPLRAFSDEARERMRSYAWPGNVRELRHTIERAVILTEEEIVDTDSLHFSAEPAKEENAPLDATNLDLQKIEREAVRRALSKHGGNITRAADELGLTRKSLYRRIEKFGL